ncbi:MAG: hypothetical protein NTW86_26315 [Candidatus Sumerlaeota bacterium]|nr:hypothetical protein [Candidatus Sumerlaeota bacterium]
MSIELTEHERTVMAKMTPQHQQLMTELTPNERKSFEKNVNVDNIEKIQSWIGTDEEIEAILFWVKGGKFDDPAWQGLTPVDVSTKMLWEKAKSHYQELRALAVRMQRRSDLTLFSQLNPGLLFNGVAPAIRCDQGGAPSDQGGFFKGIEFRLVGSIDQAIDSLSILPAEGGYQVGFGSAKEGNFTGISVYGADNYSLTQLAQLIDRRYSKMGFDLAVKSESGQDVVLDARELRKSNGNSVSLGWGRFVTLFSSKKVASVDEALSTAGQMVTFFYDRFGLERESINIGKMFGNFYILRDENFDEYVNDKPVKEKGLVMLTATLVCRRCRREMEAFRDLARDFRDVKFALVNLNSPLFKFYERVFGDMGGGNADEFRKNAAGVTPFTIVYAPDANGVLKFAEYYGTGKSDASPEPSEQVRLIKKHLFKS